MKYIYTSELYHHGVKGQKKIKEILASGRTVKYSDIYNK